MGSLENEDITVIVSIVEILILLISVFFVYRQLKISVKTTQIDSILNLYKKLKIIDKQMEQLLEKEIRHCLEPNQFPIQPPKRFKHDRSQKASRRLSTVQIEGYKLFNNKDKKIAESIISELNEIGLLIEERLIEYPTLLEIYYPQIIRWTSFLELFRRDLEKSYGKNYGKRLLRMRHKAMLYHQAYPKQRMIDIRVSNGRKQKIVLKKKTGNMITLMFWKIQYYVYRF